MRGFATLASIAALLVSCTGDRVTASESSDAGAGGSAGAPSDAGSDSAGSDGGDPSDSGTALTPLVSGRDCPIDFRVVAGTLTWADQGSVQKGQTDGVIATMPAGGCPTASPCVTKLAENQQRPSAVEVDPETSTVYWATLLDGTIWRRLPETAPAPLSTNQNFPRWLAIEPVSLSIYWTNTGQFGQSDGEIWRAWMDGTSTGLPIVTDLYTPTALILFSKSFTSTTIFWTNGGTSDFDGKVMSADAVGDFVKTIADKQSQPRGITANSSYVYWTNMGDGSLMRATHDGSEVERLIPNLNTPADVAVDGTRIYWVEAGTPIDFTDGAVKSAALDGTDVRTIASGQLDPRRIVLDATHVYWMNRGTQGLQACSLHDGSIMRAQKSQ